jgi:ketosteroid isomerase-like protein
MRPCQKLASVSIARPAVRFIYLLFSFLIFTGCHSASHPSTHKLTDAQAEERELRQASREWDQLFNDGDAAQLGSLYADSAISMPPNSPTVQGRRAIQADFESFFSANVARHQTIVDGMLQDGDVAIEAAHYRLTYKPRAGGSEVVETGRHVECRRKIGGRWQIVVEIWNSDSPASK